MWLMTTRGFYSAVQHRDDPTKVMIRARCVEDIDALAELIPDAEPYHTPNADYAWRIVTSASNWVGALTTMALEVDYPNFKNAVKSPKHHAAYSSVWGTMLRLDDRHNVLWGDEQDDGPWEDEVWAADVGGEVPGDVTPINFVPNVEREHEKTVPFFDPPDNAA